MGADRISSQRATRLDRPTRPRWLRGCLARIVLDLSGTSIKFPRPLYCLTDRRQQPRTSPGATCIVRNVECRVWPRTRLSARPQSPFRCVCGHETGRFTCLRIEMGGRGVPMKPRRSHMATTFRQLLRDLVTHSLTHSLTRASLAFVRSPAVFIQDGHLLCSVPQLPGVRQQH